jgi:hypothetical protein
MMSGSLSTRIPSKSKMMARSEIVGLPRCRTQALGFRIQERVFLEPES